MASLRLIYAASEVAPYAKTGGLADVAGALPKALKKQGAQVSVAMPRYSEEKSGSSGSLLLDNLMVPFGSGVIQARVFVDETQGAPSYFIEAPHYFNRRGIYGPTPSDAYPDNAERFAFFSRAVIELARRTGPPPDVIHCNDWQTGLVPLYLKTAYRGDPFFSRTKTLFTIHNLAYQGTFEPQLLELFGFGWEVFTTEGGIEFYGHASSLKAGIVAATGVSTVSRKYAEEIQTPEYGERMDGLLRWRRNDLSGILNGVDYDEWSPATDRFIASKYSLDAPEGKRACKEELLKAFQLGEGHARPIIGCISRLVDQKGFDLVMQAAHRILLSDVYLIVLGSGAKELERFFQSLRETYPTRVGVYIGFNNELAHKIEAGADMFLMPSRFEPCGLNQMYSLKYGTVPIVRATGGLDDTIEEFDRERLTGNGFKFYEYSAEKLLEKVAAARALYADQSAWRKLVENGMRADFSWDRSAGSYVALYERLVGESTD
jgi:starch synthase